MCSSYCCCCDLPWVNCGSLPRECALQTFAINAPPPHWASSSLSSLPRLPLLATSSSSPALLLLLPAPPPGPAQVTSTVHRARCVPLGGEVVAIKRCDLTDLADADLQVEEAVEGVGVGGEWWGVRGAAVVMVGSGGGSVCVWWWWWGGGVVGGGGWRVVGVGRGGGNVHRFMLLRALTNTDGAALPCPGCRVRVTSLPAPPPGGD